MEQHTTLSLRFLRVGMVGLGMIFDETYRPLLEQLYPTGLYRRDFGTIDVRLTAVASRTGSRADRLRQRGPLRSFTSCVGVDAVEQLLRQPVDVRWLVSSLAG